MDNMITFEEVLIDLINERQEIFMMNGCPGDEMLRDILYFVRNVGDVMNLDIRDEDFRRIIGVFYTDMIDNVMKEE